MTDDLIKEVSAEVERIVELSLEEQPNAFGALRDELESVLNGAESSLQSSARVAASETGQ